MVGASDIPHGPTSERRRGKTRSQDSEGLGLSEKNPICPLGYAVPQSFIRFTQGSMNDDPFERLASPAVPELRSREIGHNRDRLSEGSSSLVHLCPLCLRSNWPARCFGWND